MIKENMRSYPPKAVFNTDRKTLLINEAIISKPVAPI